ncbi:MAG: DDE-type integrase/transposase/recombinase [Flavobacteriaceae bacterium]|nr:DDE-type integrase/transposase/recombinase [Flavobacteriaceae bacterium]
MNTIENLKETISIENAIKVFNISRSTYQNYKTLVINKCDSSYFLWCVKKYPHQLLKKEILVIKDYMVNEKYRYWSKSSVYLKAIRDEKLYCCLSTFYKYCRLLGFKEKRKRQKSDDYAPIKTIHPNELWCADVTIFKTADGVKHYIHFLMDHYSRMILGYTVEKSSNGQAIKRLLQNAYIKFKPQNVTFLTDGGTENVNALVSNFLKSLVYPIKHIIAQKDVIFSNSMVEALNKTIKHEFLYPKQISGSIKLKNVLDESVSIYNIIRPQKSLGGNTPYETQTGIPIDFSRFSIHFNQQKNIRLAQN